MTQIDLSALGAQMPEREAKTMFSRRLLQDGRTELRINHSSYSLISLCKRKAYYTLERGLVSRQENEATLFGRAIHGALEVWYSAPRGARGKASAICDDSIALMGAGQEPLPHGRCTRCAAQARFLEIATPLAHVASGEKRSRANGNSLLDAYFDHYNEDPFVALTDELGPISERTFELTLAEESDSRVVFFGTIDTVLKNEETQQIVITDHKTTSALGSDFLQRIRPNWQYVGYTAAFRQHYPQHDTRTFMSNGLLVAKTKHAFARQFTEVEDSLIDEWRIALLDAAYDWWARTKMGSLSSFPMHTPDPCTQWGGCGYRTICETPSHLRENVIEALYDKRVEAAEASHDAQPELEGILK